LKGILRIVASLALLGGVITGAFQETANAQIAIASKKAMEFSQTKTIGPVGDSIGVARSGTYVYLVWEKDDEIFFTVSENGGSSFGGVVNLSNTPDSVSRNPKIVAEGFAVYVAWEERTSVLGTRDISFINSTNNGKSFKSKKNLFAYPTHSWGPMIAASQSRVYVAWHECTSNSLSVCISVGKSDEIFFVHSINKGDTFFDKYSEVTTGGIELIGKVKNISKEVNSRLQGIAASGDTVFLSWFVCPGKFVSETCTFRFLKANITD
jgi:protein involved in ribonucleotide reduction